MKKPSTGTKAGPARILFRKGVDVAGFSSSTTSNVANADATTIVRELIQNSVDAAKSVNRENTVIRFEIDEVESARLPGLPDVRNAFGHAVDSQRKLNGGAIPDVQQEIIEGFENHFNDAKCSVLSVSDNGIGLTRDTMNALLSDGRSAKTGDGGGAHGYGHLTVLPSSGIRLVYYGGHSSTEPRVAAGHCVLASFHDGRQSHKKDGYLVNGLSDDMFSPYEFLSGAQVPDLISAKLDAISKAWGSGTVVQVPFFNHFRSEKSELWNLIKKAAATNFFACIMLGEIVVEFVQGNRTQRLDRTNIESVLGEFSQEKSSRSFISGSKALDCFNTIRYGREIELKTELGSVTARILHGAGRGVSGGTSRIDLCRNGMWIVYSNSPGRQLPMLTASAFEGYQRFHLVILLKAGDGLLHKLVRNAEPPLHDTVDINRVSRESRDQLRAAFKSIQGEIRKHLKKIDGAVVSMDDFLRVHKEGEGEGSQKGAGVGAWKRFERHMRPREGQLPVRAGPGEVLEPREPDGDKKIRDGGRGGTSKRAMGKPRPFRAISVPTGVRSYEFEIIPLETLEAGNLSFKIDQSMDETCAVTSNKPHLCLKNIEIDGKPAGRNALVTGDDDSVEGVVLNDIVENRKFRIKFDFELSSHMDISADMPVGLEAVLTARFNKPGSGAGSKPASGTKPKPGTKTKPTAKTRTKKKSGK